MWRLFMSYIDAVIFYSHAPSTVSCLVFLTIFIFAFKCHFGCKITAEKSTACVRRSSVHILTQFPQRIWNARSRGLKPSGGESRHPLVTGGLPPINKAWRLPRLAQFPNKDSNKGNKLLRPLKLSDPVLRCQDAEGHTSVPLSSLHPLPCHSDPGPLRVSSILLCTPTLDGLSFQLFPQNVNHFNALSCSASLSLQWHRIWARLVLVTATVTWPLWELQEHPHSWFCRSRSHLSLWVCVSSVSVVHIPIYRAAYQLVSPCSRLVIICW